MSEPLTVTLWGVRGSIPAPGPNTTRYGGNTSCVSVEWGERLCLVIDAGTGVRVLGQHLAANSAEIFVILTHSHWDHIQGFPFFAPIYMPDRRVHMFPSPVGKDTLCAVIDQMDGAHFPVRSEDLMGQNECHMEDPILYLEKRGIQLSRIACNHPGGAFGYRIDDAGRSVAHFPDNELDPPGEPTTQFEEFVEFCRGLDVLIHDAQYLPEDMPAKHGWGHSVVDQVLRLAAEAEVKHVILHHHDPERTDDQIDAIHEWAQQWLRERASSARCSMGRDGMRLEL